MDPKDGTDHAPEHSSNCMCARCRGTAHVAARLLRRWGPVCALVLLALAGVVVMFIIMLTLSRFNTRLDALETNLNYNWGAHVEHFYVHRGLMVRGELPEHYHSIPLWYGWPHYERPPYPDWDAIWPTMWWASPADYEARDIFKGAITGWLRSTR